MLSGQDRTARNGITYARTWGQGPVANVQAQQFFWTVNHCKMSYINGGIDVFVVSAYQPWQTSPKSRSLEIWTACIDPRHQSNSTHVRSKRRRADSRAATSDLKSISPNTPPLPLSLISTTNHKTSWHTWIAQDYLDANLGTSGGFYLKMKSSQLVSLFVSFLVSGRNTQLILSFVVQYQSLQWLIQLHSTSCAEELFLSP